MQVPKRKAASKSHRQDDPHVTQEKLDEMKKNLARLLEKRPGVIKEMQEQAAFGDFSENAAYQLLKSKLRGMNNKILELDSSEYETVIKSCISILDKDFVLSYLYARIEILKNAEIVMKESKISEITIDGFKKRGPN